MRVLNWIKGKKALEIEALFKDHLTEKEMAKKTMLNFFCLTLPFIAIYLFLVINGGSSISDSKLPFFIYILVVVIASRYLSISIDARYYTIAKRRKEEEK
jgi:hypothetical protein